MKIHISLSIYNGSGSSASMEVADGGWDDSVTLASGERMGAKTACKLAAKRLREAANKFDALALETDPYNRNTHIKINKAREVK